MRRLTVILITVLALSVVSCSSDAGGTELTDAEQAWCGDPNDSEAFDAIWDEAGNLGVESVGDFMLDKAGISTDVDPDDLSAEDLSEAELEALIAIGEEFDESDDIWLEYLATEDGTKACRAAYESANG